MSVIDKVIYKATCTDCGKSEEPEKAQERV
jgi:hypothetical protein